MKRLGLDLGSSSIGWFIREDESVFENGVLTFQSGMMKGQGGYSSPTVDRRTARCVRAMPSAAQQSLAGLAYPP